jgi:hypothetical protein
MIVGIFHTGSGLGNQLHRYVASRVLAENKGLKHGMVIPAHWNFKGDGFINLRDTFVYTYEPVEFSKFQEKKIVENGIDIRSYDPEINFVKDNTVIDGEFQDPRYFEHRLDEVREWLKVEPIHVPDDVCVIGFRGGEFIGVRDLFLPYSYFQEGIDRMRAINPNMRFEVHTDDPVGAKNYFPSFPIIHDIGINWRSMRYAKHAIIANSSFYIFPRILSGGITIAPRYWARRNIGVWALPQNYYKQFTYI